MDWAAYLEHLQTVLQEFNIDKVILEQVLIRLFRNGMWLSIRAQAKENGYWKDTWEQTIKKAITAEAKAALKLLSQVREMDACCPWGHQSYHKVVKCAKEKIFNQNFSKSQELDLTLFNAPWTPRLWTGFGRTIRKISAIEGLLWLWPLQLKTSRLYPSHWNQQKQFFGSKWPKLQPAIKVEKPKPDTSHLLQL